MSYGSTKENSLMKKSIVHQPRNKKIAILGEDILVLYLILWPIF